MILHIKIVFFQLISSIVYDIYINIFYGIITNAYSMDSMDSEAGVFSSTFDISGTHIITREADKTVKIYKNDTAVRKSFFKYYRTNN